MAIFEKGNMWSIFHKTDAFIITTNPIIKHDGAVVMGRGIAAEAKKRFPQLPYDFGKQLKKLHPEIDQQNVGLIGRYEGVNIWWFMVKRHWNEPAQLGIIQDSIFFLEFGFGRKINSRIDLNFPGIGNGGLPRESVFTLVEKLPDNFHIWEKG